MLENGDAFHLQLANKANIQAPQIFDLELINGFQKMDYAVFWKTQEDIVTLTFKIGFQGADIPAGTHIVSVLPEGYRPKTYLSHGSGTTFPHVEQPILIWIGSGGYLNIRVQNAIPAFEGASVCGTLSFAAT